MVDREAAYRMVRPGSLLLAEPYGSDLWFGRSVVWVASHEISGTVGFILNKQLNLSLGEMIRDFPDGAFMPYLGGPVRTEVLNYVHRLGGSLIPDAYPVADGVFWGGDYDVVRQLIETGELFPDQIKFFLGSAGWDAGQLRGEFLRGDWGVVPGEEFELIGQTHNLWYDVVEGSCEYGKWGLVPKDPDDN